MLKIYFTAAVSYNGNLRELYQKIIGYLESKEVLQDVPAQIISGKQIVEKQTLNKDQKLTKKQIYERETRLIDEADCVIAEVSKPSLGVGANIIYALSKDKYVLSLVHQDYAQKLSPIIAGNTSDNLFIEFYNLDRLPFVLIDFIKHVKDLKHKKGKLIVIEGGDGSGKTTQAKLLVDYLKRKNVPIKYLDFPQYYHSFHGRTIAKFLRGEFGNIDEVSPYLVSLAYALDRAATKQEIHAFLKNGGYIIANRYATSNMAHQAAKFKKNEGKQKFLKWVYELEYKIHKIPKEDLVIYLYVPYKIGYELTKKSKRRKYLLSQEDIHEKDLGYRKDVEETYLYLAKNNKHWTTINCVERNRLLTPKEIHAKIIATLTYLLP